jgi:hypothetical protein
MCKLPIGLWSRTQPVSAELTELTTEVPQMQAGIDRDKVTPDFYSFRWGNRKRYAFCPSGFQDAISQDGDNSRRWMQSSLA